MAEQIRFYRATNGSTLPSIKNGAIIVVTSDLILDENNIKQYYGDMYVDISDKERLHVRPKDGVYYLSRSEWENSDQTSLAGKPYFLIDTESNLTGSYYVPKVGIGDGTTAVKNLSLFSLVSASEEQAINNKVSVRADLIDEQPDCYNLVFIKG